MTIHLLNSAVMPQPGQYHMVELNKDEFTQAVKDGIEKLKHYIGYKSTLTVVEQLTGIDIGEPNFEKTKFNDCDIFLVIRLKYRVTSAEKKVDNPSINDFEFFIGTYLKPEADIDLDISQLK